MEKDKKVRLLPMDELRARPCEVDGKPALFHRWIESDRVLVTVDGFNRYRPGNRAEVIRETFALVEYEDGAVGKVKPELVRFTPSKQIRCRDCARFHPEMGGWCELHDFEHGVDGYCESAEPRK